MGELFRCQMRHQSPCPLQGPRQTSALFNPFPPAPAAPGWGSAGGRWRSGTAAGRVRGCAPAQPLPALCTQPLKPFPSGGLLSVLQPCCAVWYEFAGIKFRRRLLRGGRGEPGSSWEASPAPAQEAAASSRRMRVCLQLCRAFCRTGPAKLHTTFFLLLFFWGALFIFFPVLF